MSLGSMAGLGWIPKFTYEDCGVSTDLTLTIPMRNWEYASMPNGGFDRAASGVGEAFVVRHDRIYALKLRFTEEEWVEGVEPMIKILTSQEQAFTVQLDKDDAATADTVRLVSPVAGTQVRPTANDFPVVLELTLELMTSSGNAFAGYPYFPSP